MNLGIHNADDVDTDVRPHTESADTMRSIDENLPNVLGHCDRH